MKPIRLTTLFFLLFSSGLESAEPADLKKVRDSYHAELERATKPVTDKYRAYLQAQKAAATKAGKLEDALAYDAEMKLIEGQKSSEPTEPEQADSTFPGSKWQWSQGQELIFDNDGGAVLTGAGDPKAWTWTLQPDGTLKINKGTFIITMDKTGKTAQVSQPELQKQWQIKRLKNR